MRHKRTEGVGWVGETGAAPSATLQAHVLNANGICRATRFPTPSLRQCDVAPARGIRMEIGQDNASASERKKGIKCTGSTLGAESKTHAKRKLCDGK